MTKKIASFLIIFLSLIVFSACAHVEHIRTFEKDGRIIDKIVVELDADFDTKVNNPEVIKQSISHEFSRFENVFSSWKDQFIENPSLLNRINTDIALRKEEAVVKDKMVYELILNFKDVDMFNLFYSAKPVYDVGAFSDIVKPAGTREIEVKPINAFLNAYDLRQDNSILTYMLDLKSASNDGKSLYNYYYELANGTVAPTKIDLQSLKITQIFSTNIERLYANADDTLTENGYTSFYWDLTNKDMNFMLQVYNIRANSVSWYYLALGISLAILVVLSFIYFKEKKQPPTVINLSDLKVNYTKDYIDNKKNERYNSQSKNDKDIIPHDDDN